MSPGLSVRVLRQSIVVLLGHTVGLDIGAGVKSVFLLDFFLQSGLALDSVLAVDVLVRVCDIGQLVTHNSGVRLFDFV